jgi:hypothetical protein
VTLVRWMALVSEKEAALEPIVRAVEILLGERLGDIVRVQPTEQKPRSARAVCWVTTIWLTSLK